MRSVGFGDAEFLRRLQGIVETQALFHLAEDDVGGRVQDSMKALQVDGGELVEEREDRDAIHHGRLEEEAFAFTGSEVAEFGVGVDDGALVRGDGVSSVVESGADVVDGGLAILDAEGGGFEENVGLGGGEPGTNVGIRIVTRHFAGGGARATLFGIEAVWIGEPAQTAGGDAGDAEGDAVAVAEFGGAVLEETD